MIDRFGILCLSQLPDQVYMWSQYADSHAGICLEFCANSSTSVVSRAIEVKYRLRFPKVPVLKLSNQEFGDKVFLRKAPWWRYEKEWRVIDSGGPGEQPFAPDELTGVVLGAKLSSKQRAAVLSWIDASRSTPALYEARMNQHKYELTIDRISGDPR